MSRMTVIPFIFPDPEEVFARSSRALTRSALSGVLLGADHGFLKVREGFRLLGRLFR